jgi:hypothetical protein
MEVIATILGLLAAVAVLSLLAWRVNLPYPTRAKLLELYDQDAINEQVLGRIETDLDLEQLRWSPR